MITSLVFFALASMCNAISDITKFRLQDTIFFNPKNVLSWWDCRNQKYYQEKLKILQISDPFHFFKMLYIGFIVISVVFYTPIFPFTQYNFLNMFSDFIAYSLLWILIFNLFYDHLLRRRF